MGNFFFKFLQTTTRTEETQSENDELTENTKEDAQTKETQSENDGRTGERKTSHFFSSLINLLFKNRIAKSIGLIGTITLLSFLIGIIARLCFLICCSTEINFEKEFNQFSVNHQFLSVDSRIELFTAGKRWYQGERTPTVITIAGEGAHDLARDVLTFLKQFSNEESIIIDAESDSILDKKEIMQRLDDGFEGKNKPIGAIFNIDKLTWDQPLFIYSYCDYDRVQFENTFLILTLNSSFEEGLCAAQIHNHLKEKWISSGGPDQSVEPAISRIKRFTVCF